jgi:hypothetical protein
VEKRMNIDNGNSFVYVGHNYKWLNQAICCVQNKWVDLDVPIELVRMVCINVWSSSLKAMIVVPNMKHSSRYLIEIQILGQEIFKLCILLFPKRTPSINMIAHIFFFTLLVCWENIKRLLTFPIPREKCMLHLAHVDIQN